MQVLRSLSTACRTTADLGSNIASIHICAMPRAGRACCYKIRPGRRSRLSNEFFGPSWPTPQSFSTECSVGLRQLDVVSSRRAVA